MNDTHHNIWDKYKKLAVDDLKSQLNELAYKVTQENATEPAHSSPFNEHDAAGIYIDVVSGAPLFSSKDKYNSGSGWPSFTRPISGEMIEERNDMSLQMPRTEIRATISDNHLGHVFPDGPRDRGGLRYCVNGAALAFVPKEQMQKMGYGEFLKEL